MAITVGVGNFTRLHALDQTVDQAADGNVFSTLGQINTAIFVEGGSSTPYQAKNFGTTPTVGYAGTWNTGNNWDLTGNGAHLYVWSRSLDPHDTEANGGMQIAATDSGDFSAYGAWDVGGQDTRKAVQEGFVRTVIDTSLAFDNSSSPPAKTSVDGVGGGGQMVSGSGQNTFFMDSVDLGSQIDITGGTNGAPGDSIQLAAQTVAFEYGVFRDTGGVFFVLSGLDFGDTGAGDSYFRDLGKVWLFEDQNVANDLYTITLDGGTGTNEFSLGTKTGTGITATGTGGNTLVANQEPFNIVATASDIDVNLYGCNFLNSTTAGGTMAFEHANVEVLSCLFSSCDEMTIRNSAVVRHSTITGSTASATEGAVNFGDTDPAIDTFRDNTIANNTIGLELVGTSSGTTTYNLRALSFANNSTADVRVDFPAGATIEINLVDGTTSPSVQNVNASTVNINDAQPLVVNGVTEGAAVKVLADETSGTVTTGDTLFEGLADATGGISDTINYEAAWSPSGLDVIARVRQQGLPNYALQDDNGTFTDETTAANSAADDDMNLFRLDGVEGQDFYYIGHAEQFNRLKLDISTAGVGGYEFDPQYWNGTIWTTFAGTVDGTNFFTIAGENTISWTLPGNWATTSVDSKGPVYWMRFRYVENTITTAPLGRKCKLDVTRYIPFVQNRVFESTGLTVTANWTVDSIAKFDDND